MLRSAEVIPDFIIFSYFFIDNEHDFCYNKV